MISLAGKRQFLNQLHLLEDAGLTLQKDLNELDEDLFEQQLRAIAKPIIRKEAEPLASFSQCGNLDDRKHGEEILSAGKCACVVLAGGTGSRLRTDAPKGCYPVSLIKRKSLYQLILEKTLAASDQAKHSLPVAFMFSPLNNRASKDYLEKNAFFGLDPKQFFSVLQEMWPYLNFEKKLFLESRDRLAKGPNGNGSIFRLLQKTGILAAWEKAGIQFIRVIPIDNPLADPFDAELLGFHARNKNDVTIQAAQKQHALEKVGSIVMIDKRINVVEYTEIGDAFHPIANLGLYCFSLSFVKGITQEKLPIHCVKKAVPILKDGNTVLPTEPNAWKCEEFLFDILPKSEKTGVLVYPRSACFAPLKNFRGEDSIDAVQAALLQADRKAFQRASEIAPPPGAWFELAQSFHYPTATLLKKWRGKALPNYPYYVEY